MADARIDELKALLPQCLLPDWVRLGSRLVRLLRDRHHPDAHDALLERLLTQARASVLQRHRRHERVPRVTYPPDLPITARKDEIIAAIRAHRVVVVAGETGSGKTTQLPKMCLDAGLGIAARIGCTQPRRVAALSISQRIAEELNVAWGREVGCQIRFDDRSSPDTYIKLMTDGILLAETQGDPLLTGYDAIIIDEAHERSLNIDFLLGHLKGLLQRRDDLKVVITSATIDTAAFSQAFDNAPIIEVSGRMFPVEVVYAPGGRVDGGGLGASPMRPPEEPDWLTGRDSEAPEAEDVDYVEAAVRATEQILRESGSGDILIFLPGERDIRETSDALAGRLGSDAELVPLFGRLSAADQQRVFAPSFRRKIVVATNIAETSLTIPGIRYVIDAGMARISRYNPRTRTRRLPIEPVSQSSANQRKGRAGRVQDGVCIRLYSEEDFLGRPPYTQPEIQRSNLAEVILRMKAYRLGDIETFPFLNPPSPAAIQGGYTLLQELGALDAGRDLTPMGRDLARLPIDPTLGRMLLQSQQEHATRELLIIAAGLAIQDPRERPSDQREAAQAAHRRFNDPRSDFIALLNIWNAVHNQWESLRTQNARRRFCRTHFLSYLRMREWQDLHAQLHAALSDLSTVRLNESNAAYEAIHRSILAGLLGHIAQRQERNTYLAAGNRTVTVFPGSSLFERFDQPRKGGPPAQKSGPKPKSNQPAWLVAGEIVETSQLFARTVAGIDPAWIVQLAPHICQVTHQNPHWSASAGRVLVEEIITLHKLEIQRRHVAYGNVKPDDATAIFIRSALVEGDLFPAPPKPRDDEDDLRGRRGRDDLRGGHGRPQLRAELLTSVREDRSGRPTLPFLEHNQRVRQRVETWQTRVRRHDLGDLDDALCQFYAAQLHHVSSLVELQRYLRENPDPRTLCATEADIIGDGELRYDSEAFPETVPLGGHAVEVRYSYAPGEDWDGVTLKLPVEVAREIPIAAAEWAVPGMRAELVGELLRALPKTARRELMPFPPKIDEIVRELRPVGRTLRQDLARFIHQRYGIEVSAAAWSVDSIPPHFRPRFEVVDGAGRILGAGRELEALRPALVVAKTVPPTESPEWRQAAREWERFGLTGWTFGDLPAQISVSTSPPVTAWPGLSVEDGGLCVRLFRGPEAARRASLAGVQRLVEQALQKDMAWMQKDLRGIHRLAAAHAGLGTADELEASAFAHLRRQVLPAEPLPALTRAHFEAAVAQSKARIPGLALRLIDAVAMILDLRQQVIRRCGPPPVATAPAAAPAPAKPRTLTDFSQLAFGAAALPAPAPVAKVHPVAAELGALMPPRFLETLPPDRLAHLPRFLKALLIRAERAANNPGKDEERARLVRPYADACRQLAAQADPTAEGRRLLEEFRWLLEEFKVSLFAQELGTAIPVSAKRLDELLARVRAAL